MIFGFIIGYFVLGRYTPICLTGYFRKIFSSPLLYVIIFSAILLFPYAFVLAALKFETKFAIDVYLFGFVMLLGFAIRIKRRLKNANDSNGVLTFSQLPGMDIGDVYFAVFGLSIIAILYIPSIASTNSQTPATPAYAGSKALPSINQSNANSQRDELKIELVNFSTTVKESDYYRLTEIKHQARISNFYKSEVIGIRFIVTYYNIYNEKACVGHYDVRLGKGTNYILYPNSRIEIPIEDSSPVPFGATGPGVVNSCYMPDPRYSMVVTIESVAFNN